MPALGATLRSTSRFRSLACPRCSSLLPPPAFCVVCKTPVPRSSLRSQGSSQTLCSTRFSFTVSAGASQVQLSARWWRAGAWLPLILQCLSLLPAVREQACDHISAGCCWRDTQGPGCYCVRHRCAQRCLPPSLSRQVSGCLNSLPCR